MSISVQLTKIPARKSPHVTISGSTPKGQTMLGTYKLKTTNGNSASVVTPFRLTTEATQTPVSTRKPVFDLKASLSGPLSYEPHKERNNRSNMGKNERRRKQRFWELKEASLWLKINFLTSC